uniref:Uncharacterized protein n=1 Tax=Romanomermis culicivorax TaxID=13658 RepID=A0A915L4Z5_ROMCU
MCTQALSCKDNVAGIGLCVVNSAQCPSASTLLPFTYRHLCRGPYYCQLIARQLFLWIKLCIGRWFSSPPSRFPLALADSMSLAQPPAVTSSYLTLP